MNLYLNSYREKEVKRVMKHFNANDEVHLLNILITYASLGLVIKRAWPPMTYKDFIFEVKD